VNYSQAYTFKYSPRPGTPAATAEDHVPEQVKIERLAELQALLAEQQTAFNTQYLGQTMPVLFDRPGRKDGQLAGRSPWLHAVHAAGKPEWQNQIINVTITAAGPRGLTGNAQESA
jgi:tRNA-2-methylthio-N6-dimethylallyladenosine synthase